MSDLKYRTREELQVVVRDNLQLQQELDLGVARMQSDIEDLKQKISRDKMRSNNAWQRVVWARYYMGEIPEPK